MTDEKLTPHDAEEGRKPSILCLLGIHRWGPWKTLISERGYACFWKVVQSRTCTKCGRCMIESEFF